MLTRVLIDVGVTPTLAKLYAAPLVKVMARFEINTMPRSAAFLAQILHESSRLARMEESLWYTTPERIVATFDRLKSLPADELKALCRNPHGLANMAYGSRNGNRGVMSGDGWRYRGSGAIQITGLAAFVAAQKASGRPYVDHPELVRENPEDAIMSAGLYWDAHGCNKIVDEDDFDGVSKLINLGNRKALPSPNGAQDRRDLYDEARLALVNADPALLSPP